MPCCCTIYMSISYTKPGVEFVGFLGLTKYFFGLVELERGLEFAPENIFFHPTALLSSHFSDLGGLAFIDGNNIGAHLVGQCHVRLP